MASIGTQNWAKDRISPHKERLWRVLKSGVARLNRMSADDRLMFNGRCAADVLNAFVIGEARDEFESVRGSTLHREKQHDISRTKRMHPLVQATRRRSSAFESSDDDKSTK